MFFLALSLVFATVDSLPLPVEIKNNADFESLQNMTPSIEVLPEFWEQTKDGAFEEIIGKIFTLLAPGGSLVLRGSTDFLALFLNFLFEKLVL